MNTVTALLLVILSVSQILHQFFFWQIAMQVGIIALIALVFSLFRIFQFREWALFSIAVSLAVSLFVQSGDNQAIILALEKAAFFAAFIYLVTLLKEAASRSPSVLDLGHYLTRQPKSRRYYSLSVGGHAMGVLLNFGAISLLTPLIQRGVRTKATTPESIELGERQQISALLRGFSWMIMWSPTALTQAVLVSQFPKINVVLAVILGIAASIVMLLLGWVLERYEYHSTPEIREPSPPSFPRKSALRFAFVCLLLISITYFVVWLHGVSGAVALMVVAPITMIGWLAALDQSQSVLNRTLSVMQSSKSILVDTAIPLGKGAITLGTAGFIGIAAAHLAPVGQFAHWLEDIDMPQWLFLCLLPIIINLGGQVALSPIMVVVFLSAVINELPVMPADPTLIVYALGAGWALSMTASPNATATLLIAGITNIAPTKLTWRWNGHYALICYCFFVVSFILLSTFM